VRRGKEGSTPASQGEEDGSRRGGSGRDGGDLGRRRLNSKTEAAVLGQGAAVRLAAR
jgi:hypothetical protein